MNLRNKGLSTVQHAETGTVSLNLCATSANYFENLLAITS